MYAAQAPPIVAPVSLRLIGVLDADLVEAFGVLERTLVGLDGSTVLVDVRDVDVVGESEMRALAGVIRAARVAGRDVRLDARSLHWKRIAKENISLYPSVDAELRSSVRRTVILAHSVRKKRR